MPLVDVELGEVIVRQLDLGTVEYLKAHADENVLYLVKDVVHGVLVTHAVRLARKRHVHGLALELELHELFREVCLALVNGALYIRAQLVGELPHGGALLGGELAHLAQYRCQLTLLAEIFNAQRFQNLNIVAVANGFDRGVSQPLHQFSHCFTLLDIKISSRPLAKLRDESMTSAVPPGFGTPCRT